jgi:cysteine desulfurase family protein (TIGR01976 family)
LSALAFDPNELRSEFPSLTLRHNEHPAIFFDNPGGTQVPNAVIEATANYYRERNANSGGAFFTSHRTDETILEARQAMTALLNAPGADNIVFGQNMTTLTFQMARAFARTIQPGDEIVVTNLDHDANVTPWMDMREVGANINVVDIHREDGTLDMESLRDSLSERTRLVAVTYASNALGSIVDVAEVVRLAHAVGALVYVDAVQYAPHAPIDVQALDCDFLACSAYKFFGPHIGVLYGKTEHLTELKPYKVRPAKDLPPSRWETGTLNHAALAGVSAAVGYLESIGERFGTTWREEYAAQGFTERRLTLKTALRTIKEVEKTLSLHLLRGLAAFEDLKIYGITDTARLEERLPTVAFTWPRLSPQETAERLGEHGICCWNGNYYALRLMERLGLEAEGGAVRIGLTHYNTTREIERLIEVLKSIS